MFFFVSPIDKNEKTQDYQTHYTQPKSINQTRNQKKKTIWHHTQKKRRYRDKRGKKQNNIDRKFLRNVIE